MDVQHSAYAQFLVKLWTKFIPKHEGHRATLVSNFKVCLKYDKDPIGHSMIVRSCSYCVTKAQLVQTHLEGIINLEPKLAIVP